MPTDYESDWREYALDAESELRFLSLDHEDLIKICDCIDPDSDNIHTDGCIPVHYNSDTGQLYILKEGPHSRVCGETDTKKSRTVAFGAVAAGTLARHSQIITDPKGEIYSNAKIRKLQEDMGYDVRVLDFRNFDKDGYNILSHAYDLMKEGRVQESDVQINRFTGMLVDANKCPTADPIWNNLASDLVSASARILRDSLIQQPDGKSRFHLGSVLTFIRQDKESVQSLFNFLLKDLDNSPINPIRQYCDIVSTPATRTYSSIVHSAKSLLTPFTASEALLKMLSIQTFDIKDLYQKPTAVYLIIPDETNAYNQISGHLIDMFYQLLVEEFTKTYQNKTDPACRIDICCDEIASIYINDMSSKISAARSRKINFTLIYQSEKQMELAYKDFGTIRGNTKNYIFLGSSDYDILCRVSSETGKSSISADGNCQPLVTDDNLRRMEMTRTYKDALILTGNHVLCARLPDYDVYHFLKAVEPMKEKPGVLTICELVTYTPEEVAEDYRRGIVWLPVKKRFGFRRS